MMFLNKPGPFLFIQLFNEQREPVSNATFYLKTTLTDQGIPLEPEFDPGLVVYTFQHIPEGAYILEVRHKDYQPLQQPVVLARGEQQELVLTLAAASQSFFIQGSRRQPYQPLNEERVIILFNTALSPDHRKSLAATIKKLGLEEIHEPTVVPGGRLFRLTGKKTFQAVGKKIKSTLEKQEGILQVASVLEAGDKKMIMLTDEITVKFKDRANNEQIKDFLERYQLSISRNPRAANLYRLNSPSRTSRELMELCDELRFDPLVEKLDSNITSTYRLAALNISDYLFEEQWDFKLINAPGAWEMLQNDPQRTAKGNTAFGNPEVIIAVCDVGTDLSHPDLNGQLSNGADKIGVVFDFHHMVPNMDNPGTSHGTICSSVATAITNTQEGISGIAGNSQLMVIQINPMLNDTDADMIEWVAGIDPGTAGFPAAPQGASVMSNSWTRPMPFMPLDVAAAVDRVTTYGRQGKGTILFFGAGNDHSFYEPEAAYATHPKVSAISASTLDGSGKNEIFTSFSNFGAGIQFCAPGKDGTFDTHPASGDGFTATHSPFAASPFAKTTIDTDPLPPNTRPNSIKVVDSSNFIDALTELVDVIIGSPGSPGAERFSLLDIDPLQDILTLDRPWVRSPLPGDQVLRVDGNCPGNGSTQTTLAADATAGQIIQVNNIAQFSAGKAVMINPGTPQAEAHAIQRVEPATSRVFLMTDLRHPANCNTGTRVDVGPADYLADVGGTSYTTPVCAGIAALCLAANKNLSWVEVRDIMRLTARKINIGETGTTITPGTFRYGKWRDRSGKDIVSDTGQLNPLDSPVETTNFSLNNTRDVVFLDSAFGFEIGQAIAVTGQGHDGFNHRDFRIVIDIEDDALFLDSPLSATFSPQHVEAGLKPYYSAFYGYGRVDAGKAVEAALDSVANYQHLVIRNNLHEDGTAPPAFIQSPDLWVTNSALKKDGEVYTLYRSATGPDDFSHTDFKYDGAQNAVFYIEIDSTSPGGDTYRWARNGKTIFEKVPIGTGMDELEDNFFIGFNSRTSHRIGDNWTVFIDRIESAMDYTRDAPHESPGISNERYIHARIKNLVSSPAAAQYTNHDCWVRFYIALCSGKTANATAQGTGFDSNFYFSATGKNNDWDDTKPINRITTGLAATYFVGEVAVPEGIIAPADNSSPSTGTFIASIPWQTEDLPPAALEHSIFLMAHIAPFHGQVNGNGAHNNSCLSYREIAFADFSFKDQDDNQLENQLAVDPFGNQVTQPFSVDVQTEIGQLLTEKLVLEIVRINDNGTEEKAVFHHDGAAWVFDPANPAWPGLIVNAPVVWETGNPSPAAGPQKEISFTGEFQASKEHKQIIIRPRVVSKHSTAIIATEEYEVDILQSDELPTGIGSELLKKNPPPRSYAFADMSNLSQSADQGFGPIPGQETDSFRTTSLFTASADTNAYAITDGFVFLQPGADPNTVNLVLRPFKQPVIGFTPVKYFIYRGLRKADFLDPSNETKVLPDHISNSEFIKRQRTIFTAQQAPGTDFLSIAFGYDTDPVRQPPGSILDSYFFKVVSGMQLPFVTRGTQLGRFLHNNNAFGLDILLEEGSFTTTLSYVRKKAHIISVNGMSTGTDAARLLKKLRQDEILNFLDPAAFYGMHITRKGTVDTRNASGETDRQKNQQIYEEVVNKFHNRNKVYLDIRNENGNSYNFYGNYKGAAGTPDATKNIKIGTSGNQLVSKIYQTHGWPVLIEDRPAQNTTADANQLHCSLRFDDNTKPMLYVEEGVIGARPLLSSSSAFIDPAELGDAAAVWTAGIGFDIPNTGPSGAKLNIATIIKLFYGRNITSTTWPDTVLKTESPTDNVFGPLDLTPLWKSDSQIQWITAQDKKYVDLTDRGYIAERGVALDGSNGAGTGTGRIVFFAAASDYYAGAEHQNMKGITGGVSTKLTFFEAAGFFQGLKLFFDQLILTGSTINTLRLTPATGQALPPDAVLLLCISRSELETLKAVPGFHPSYPRYARIDKVEEATDINNKPYIKYQLKVQGLDDNGKYKLAAPAPAVFVYSVDGFLYFSDAYSKDEPLPTTYTRTAEENIGTLLSDDKLLSWEDYFIGKDQLGAVGGVQKTAFELVRDFIDGVTAIPNDDKADRALQLLINNQPKTLLRRMRAFANDNTISNADDRILYWSRIRMKVALQSHALLLQSFSARNSLVEQFETVSRGYGAIDFSSVSEGIKKVLLVGFDPYFLQPHEGSANNIHNSNPSGSVALALHGKLIPHFSTPGRTVAFVQSVIFPIRFADYDKEGQGIVEEYLNRFIDPTVADYSPVDAIIVMDKYQPDAFMVARFAARRRGARRDNNFQHSTEIPLTITGDEFYESTLPIGDAIVALHFEHFFNQAYEYRIKANKAIKKITKEKWVGDSKISNNPDGNDPANLLPVNQPSADIKAIRGAVDPYFANEVFYRICALRDKKNKLLKAGLLLLPRLQGTNTEVTKNKKLKKDFDPALTKEVIQEVVRMISVIAPTNL